MSTTVTTTTARAQEIEDLESVAAHWPLLSVQEVRRLVFLAYRRHTGRVCRPTPVRADVEALCTALLRRPVVPTRPVAPPGVPGVPPLWAAWAEQQRARRQRAG